MSDAIFLYLGLFVFVAVLFQFVCEFAVYCTLLDKFTGSEIVTKKEDPEKFQTALVVQIAFGCIFIILQLIGYLIA